MYQTTCCVKTNDSEPYHVDMQLDTRIKIEKKDPNSESDDLF